MRNWLVPLILLVSASSWAAGPKKDLQQSGANIRDQASLQRGAQLFMNYCFGCHSLEFQRYSRTARDLGLTEQQMMDNLVFTGAGFFDTMTIAMDREDSAAWFGAPAPDLSLMARARKGGADYIFTFLNSFYLDESAAIGWNNTLKANVSMPHVLWELQGVKRPVFEPDANGEPRVVRFERVSDGMMDQAQYEQAIRDIAAFLTYVGEPAALERYRYGPWVMLYLSLFTLLAWLLKREYWKDVH